VGGMSGMDTGTRNALIATTVLALLAVVVAWFLHTYERVEKQITLPPHGEAGYNPLYALKKTLQAQGITVNSRQRLSLGAEPLGARDTLLVLNDPRSMTPVDARHLLDWVAGGGHLLLRTPPGMTEDDATIPVLDALGIRVTDESPDCEALQVEGEDHHVEFCSGRRFFFDFNEVRPEHSWGDLQAGYVYARIGHGRGKVDVLADFDFLTNSGPQRGNPLFADADPRTGGLRDAPHRALTRQLLAPNYGHGTMHLVYAAQMPSLLRRVLLQGWPIWAPLLLALLAWLWLRGQRFGPLLPPLAGERRSLLEHVRASGAHLFRYHKRAPLYFAVRQSFLARLRRRDPVAAALSGEPQISAVAERLGIPAASVRVALQVPASHDKLAFRDRISTLIQMRNRL